MRYYMEVTLIPNADIDQNFLWSKIFQQLHLGLVELQDDANQVAIGLGFPEYKGGQKCNFVGNKCRLFANDEVVLRQYDVNKWLSHLADYVHVTSIRPVPENISRYAVYQRYQPKVNVPRLARRYAKRHQIGHTEAMQHYEGMVQPDVPYPFIWLKSMSSKQNFCLWIKKQELKCPSSGTFSTYGLSQSTTVPEF